MTEKNFRFLKLESRVIWLNRDQIGGESEAQRVELPEAQMRGWSGPE